MEKVKKEDTETKQEENKTKEEEKETKEEKNESSLGKKIGYGLTIGGAAVGLIATAPILLGFGSAGIAAGSLAASIQSSIGLVSAGSWFASFTSLGMTGVFTTTALTAAVVSGAAGAGTYLLNQDSQKEDKKEPEDENLNKSIAFRDITK